EERSEGEGMGGGRGRGGERGGGRERGPGLRAMEALAEGDEGAGEDAERGAEDDGGGAGGGADGRDLAAEAAVDEGLDLPRLRPELAIVERRRARRPERDGEDVRRADDGRPRERAEDGGEDRARLHGPAIMRSAAARDERANERSRVRVPRI